jgi:hypothetical protein
MASLARTSASPLLARLVSEVDSGATLSFAYRYPRSRILGLPRDVSTVCVAYEVSLRSRVHGVVVYRVSATVLPGYGEDSSDLFHDGLLSLLSSCVGDCPGMEYTLYRESAVVESAILT